MSDGPFAVLYRWRVPAQMEAAFREQWRVATLDLRDHHGGLGSLLSKTGAGEWVAIALWPNEAARTAAFTGRTSPPPTPGVEFLGEERLSVIDDLWLASAFQVDRSSGR
jgi:hypothetical protein